jgi:branched-subunit amino acid transport protein
MSRDGAMTAWLVILAVGIGSYMFRISMLVLTRRSTVPGWLQRSTRFAVPTAFAALAATALAHQISASNAGVGTGIIAPSTAVVAAVVAVRRTGSSHTALLVGMPTLWMVTALWR